MWQPSSVSSVWGEIVSFTTLRKESGHITHQAISWIEHKGFQDSCERPGGWLEVVSSPQNWVWVLVCECGRVVYNSGSL